MIITSLLATRTLYLENRVRILEKRLGITPPPAPSRRSKLRGMMDSMFDRLQGLAASMSRQDEAIEEIRVMTDKDMTDLKFDVSRIYKSTVGGKICLIISQTLYKKLAEEAIPLTRPGAGSLTKVFGIPIVTYTV